MANPSVQIINKDQWVKVATDVITGIIHLLTTDAHYRQTYRETTDPAPTDKEEGAAIQGIQEVISAQSGIDVYIYCEGSDGKIRVDV